MAWIRVDANIDNHPKFIEAGFWGSIIVQSCWRIAKCFDRQDGDITPYWQPDYLIRVLRLDAERCSQCEGLYPLEVVERGMAAALTAGLVVERDGRIIIHDWEQYQVSANSTDRVRRHRKRMKRHETNETFRNGETVSEQVKRSWNTTVQDNTIQDRTNSRARDLTTPPSKPTTTTTADEARELEQRRRRGSPSQVATCPTCGDPWRLIRHSDGDFYGHGGHGGRLGCRETCDAEEYAARAAETPEQRRERVLEERRQRIREAVRRDGHMYQLFPLPDIEDDRAWAAIEAGTPQLLPGSKT